MNNQMGLWPFTSSSAADDRAAGLRMLQTYFETAKNYPEFKFGDFDSFLADVEKYTTLADDMGKLRRTNDLTTSEADSTARLIQLADASHGQATPVQMIQAVGGTGDTRNWSSFIPQATVAVTEGTAESIASGVATGIPAAIDFFVKYKTPILLIGGGLALAYIMDKTGLNRLVKR